MAPKNLASLWTPVDEPAANPASAWTPVNDITNPAGLPDGVNLPGLPPHAPAPPISPGTGMLAAMAPNRVKAAISTAVSKEQNAADKVNYYGDNLAAGVGKSILNTGAGVLKTANNMLPPGFIPSDAIEPLSQAAQPHNTTQKVGMGAGSAAQFLIPGLGEERAGLYASELLPEAAPYVAPLARGAVQSLGSGAINKLQGGSFTGGAVAGGIGSGVGQAAKALAPEFAESAMGTRRVERSWGKTPGQTVLDNTAGFSPDTVNASAGAKLSELGSANGAIERNYPGTVSIQPGLDSIDNKIATATAQNSKGVSIPQLYKVRTNLTESPPINNITGGFTSADDPNAGPSLPLSPNQTATGAANIKRGLRTDYISNFNPENMKGTRQAANQAAGAINGSLNEALGSQYAANNHIMSGLYSVKDATARHELDPSLMQKLASKGLAHTGAGAGAIAGGYEGAKHGGTGGAVLGGLAGFAGPEALFNPTAQMILARSLYSPAFQKTVSGAVGSGLQLNRPASLYGK